MLMNMIDDGPMKNVLRAACLAMPMFLGGCASTQQQETGIPLVSDPRIGDTVRQVCFANQIDSWNSVDNDRNAVILKMNNRDYFKLKISGGCDPQWAMSTLAVIRRGGSNCFSQGDRIKTDADPFRDYGSSCVITAINKWDPEAANKTAPLAKEPEH